MRKFFHSVYLFLLIISYLTADITSDLTQYIQLDCSLESVTHRTPKSHPQDENCDELLHSRTRSSLPTEGKSKNWSGYASATNLSHPKAGRVSTVSGAWVVPSLKASTVPTYSSLWVGIDGYANDTVEQIGTEHDWNQGKQSNYAWFEMYPQPAYEIVGFPVDIGDLMQAEVDYKGNHVFQLSLVNHTQQVYTMIPTTYTTSAAAQRSSAEWIVEAPSTSTSLLPLANFQEAIFMNCTATIHHITGGIKHAKWQTDLLTMVSSRGKVKAHPSTLSHHQESFTVTWHHQ